MTIGEQIADEFSRDKCHLTDAEQRRLAGLIDARMEAQGATAERDAIRAANTVALAMLKDIEWGEWSLMDGARTVCPSCRQNKYEGHLSIGDDQPWMKCQLAEAIAAIEALSA